VELLGILSSGFGIEIRITALEIRRADYATPLYPRKLALDSPTSGGIDRYSSLADLGHGVFVISCGC
jgi:hypothetical protein